MGRRQVATASSSASMKQVRDVMAGTCRRDKESQCKATQRSAAQRSADAGSRLGYDGYRCS